MRIVGLLNPAKLVCIVTLCLILAGYSSWAQQSVSIGSTTLKNNAVLYLVSQGKNQGLIIPVVSNKSAVSTPDNGMLVYDESDNKLYYKSNNGWNEVTGGGVALAGDLAGTTSNPTIGKLQGKLVSAASPTNGQILKYNSTTLTWELSTDVGAAYTAGTGITVSGSNQIGISNDGVTTTQIAPNTITNVDLNKTTIPVSGFGAATASVDLGTQKIINLAAPTLNTDAATKAYVDATGITNPMTTTGDLIVGGVSGAPTRHGGAPGFLKSTGAVAPAWSSVNLTSTDITGTLPLANGGTGATTSSAARTNLGLGSLATLNTVTTTEITDATLVDVDVNSAAAIAGTKISPNFGAQNVVTTGTMGVGTATPSTKLQVVNSAASNVPLANIEQQDAAGDAALSFSGILEKYTLGSNSTGSFKISNATALGTNDHFEIRPGVTDNTFVSKIFLDMGARGQDGVQVTSTSNWGTSIHISNGTSTSTTAGYTMAVTGPGGPTSQAGDFALVSGLSPVMSIGYASGISSYSTNFTPVQPLFGGPYPMRVGVNMNTTPGYNLEVVGSAGKNTGTAWVNTSDIRLKKDISSFTDGLNVITKINPIWFRYNGKGGTYTGENLQVGVAAQEMKTIAPYTVGTFKAKYDASSPEQQEFYNFDYNAIGYALINAVKELDVKVKALEEENKKLKLQLKDASPPGKETEQQLKAELNTQKSRTDRLEAELQEIRKVLSLEAKGN